MLVFFFASQMHDAIIYIFSLEQEVRGSDFCWSPDSSPWTTPSTDTSLFPADDALQPQRTCLRRWAVLTVTAPTKEHSTENEMHQNFSSCESFQVVLLPLVYGVEFIVALTGNLFALWLLVVRERRNWHTGVVLSCNLAISDLLYVLTLPLLIVYYSMEKHWIFSDFACKMERYLFTCNLYVSIFFVMAISVNRCVALACPFFTRSHVEPVHIKIISVIIWIVVAVMSCPVFKFASVCQNKDTAKTVCLSYCDQDQKQGHFIYKLFLAVFGCLVPFLVTFASYCVVIRVAWKNVSITAVEKGKIVILVVSVLVLYAFSFLPYHFFQMYNLYLRTRNATISGVFDCWIYSMYQVSKGLASLNMCIHPILYLALFDSMRVACCGKGLEDNNSVAMRK